MKNAENGDTVKVHYTGRLADGQTFDSSVGRDPLEFQLGAQNVIPGFEKATLGLSVGESRTVTIPCKEAYGETRPELVQTVPRSDIPPEIELKEGMQLQTGGPQPQVLTVVELSEDSVKLDANHPLAGKDLTFDIQLVEIG